MSEDLLKKYERPVYEELEIDKIVVPEIRVTAVMPDELIENFATSIKQLGIVNPIKVIFDGQNYILVDGLHRLLEAKKAGAKTVPCVVAKGSLKDVLVQNLATGKLQGRGKVSDMIRVVKYLYEEEHMGIDEIARATGYTVNYIDNLFSIAKAHEEILKALDEEKIPLGAAIEIAKIPDEDAQLRVLYQVIMYGMKVKDVKDLVKKTIELLQKKAEKEVIEGPRRPREEVEIECWLCGEKWPAKDMRSPILCPTCLAVLIEEKAKIRASLAEMSRQARQAQKEEESEGETEITAINEEGKNLAGQS